MRLRRLQPGAVRAQQLRRSAEVERTAAAIVARVRAEGEPALRALAEQHDGLPAGAPLVRDRACCDAALAALDAPTRALLERTAARIAAFAGAQRECLGDLALPVEGGAMGHEVVPVAAAGCYAPSGRHPLPSSVLMTAVTARVAGVERVVVATPSPSPLMLAAAAVADAAAVLACGGAQAIAALAYGVATPRVDLICGPGNAYVTAAKRAVFGEVAIDMLAGPSELVVVADATADPELIARDLLAQAEHDVDAVPLLVTTSAGLVPRVEAALRAQLADLPTRAVAEQSLAGNGGAVVVADLAAAAAACNELAPEHLQVMLADPAALRSRLRHYGALFTGRAGGEVFGDYGIGPNHVLPTAGAARATGGLSVFTFLRVRTWLDLRRAAPELRADCAALARLEGLEAHARAAAARRDPRP